MMSLIFVVIHEFGPYGVDWNKLAEDLPADSRLLILTTSECTKDLKYTNPAISVIVTESFDEDTLAEKIARFARPSVEAGASDQMQVTPIIKIATVRELNMVTTAQLRERFNCEQPTSEVIQDFIDKPRMKKHLTGRLAIPKYIQFNKEKAKTDLDTYIHIIETTLGDYPFFVKPIDGAGSIGTHKIENADALKTWYGQLSDEDKTEYEIDEFIDGTLFHCDSVIIGGKPYHTFVNQYLHPNAEALHGQLLASIIEHPTSERHTKLKQFAEAALACFPKVPDGLTHMEIFERTNGELVFLEVACRPPGCQGPEVDKICTGVDIRELHLRLSLGLVVDPTELQKLINPMATYAAMVYLVNPPQDGTISERHAPSIQSSFEMCWYRQLGDVIHSAQLNGNAYACGHFLMWNHDYAVLLRDFETLREPYTFVTLAPLSLPSAAPLAIPSVLISPRKQAVEHQQSLEEAEQPTSTQQGALLPP